jgi:IS30 family transposase
MSTWWSDPVSDDEANRRAAGRRHYNQTRKLDAWHRTQQVIELLQDRGLGYGVRTQIARELGVHRSTITRDVKRILRTDGTNCPTCERWMGHTDWDRLREKRGLSARERSA